MRESARPSARPWLWRAMVAGLLMGVGLGLTGCGNQGGAEDDITNTISLTIDASPSNPDPGEIVTFTVTGSVTRGTITSSRIDYEGTGSWDATHYHGASAIVTTFSHAYPEPAGYNYNAHVEILEGNRVLKVATTLVSVGVVRR